MREADDKRNNLVDDKKNGLPNRSKVPDSKQPVPSRKGKSRHSAGSRPLSTRYSSG